MAHVVRSAASGDEDAWDTIVACYSGLVWSVIRTYRLGEAADDVLQTTWLLLVQHLPRLRHPEAVGAWLATTARREALRAIRQASREAVTRDGTVPDLADRPEAGPEPQALAAEVDRLVQRCMNELPEPCRALMLMLTADPPATYKEVSAALTMPIGSIGPTRARCLGHLRRSLKQYDGPA
jgi:RNA polymerase sigma factor (sigma-70 family)